MRKRIMLGLSVLLLIGFFTGCSSTKEYKRSAYAEYSNFTKIADHLFETTYRDYDLNAALSEQTIKKEPNYAVGGSVCRSDHFLGCSFDRTYSECCSVVVNVPASENRYANIGVSSAFSTLTEDRIYHHLSEDALPDLIPLFISDGINEKGVACACTGVPSGDLQNQTTGTHPGSPALNMLCIGRFVLDHAASAEEAVGLLNQRNIAMPFDPFGLSEQGEACHWMIADEKETLILEFIGNEMKVIKDENVMTDHYLSLASTAHAHGLERAELLKTQAEKADTIEKMAQIMESVQYTNTYSELTNPFWMSEYFGQKIDGTVLSPDNHTAFKDQILEKVQADRSVVNNWIDRKRNPSGFKMTMHMTVYDLQKRLLRVTVQEKYEHTYFFSVDEL